MSQDIKTTPGIARVSSETSSPLQDEEVVRRCRQLLTIPGSDIDRPHSPVRQLISHFDEKFIGFIVGQRMSSLQKNVTSRRVRPTPVGKPQTSVPIKDIGAHVMFQGELFPSKLLSESTGKFMEPVEKNAGSRPEESKRDVVVSGSRPEESKKREVVESRPEESKKREVVESRPEKSKKREVVESRPEESKKQEEVVESRPEESKKREVVESRPEEDKKREVVQSRPEESKKREVVQSRPEESKKREVVQSRPEESKKREVVKSRPEESRREVVDSQPKESKKEAAEFQPQKSKVFAKSRPTI